MTDIAPADIRVVLIETSHPGNIGAVARAMKNMGLRELVLVRPREFPSPEATARASGADDLLRAARVTGTLLEAIGDCGLVAATTSRDRDLNFRVQDVRPGAERMVREARRGPVALMFGNERTGFTNEELALAHLLLRIPANPEYPSLNLAMAVQIVSYELWRARGAQYIAPPLEVPLAPAVEMERLFVHFEQVLELIDFRDRTASGKHLMNRIRRLLVKAEPDTNEVNILRGILTAVQNKRRLAGSDAAAEPAAVAPSASAAASAAAPAALPAAMPTDPA
jgi:TrmH family RNA methyltransferase